MARYSSATAKVTSTGSTSHRMGNRRKLLMSAISERERELRRITDRLLEPGPESLSSRLDGLRAFAVSRLNNLRKLISQPESVDQARAALAEFFGSFTLDPSAQAGESAYSIRGEVDFFGGDSSARTGGAGGPVRTVRPYPFSFSLAYRIRRCSECPCIFWAGRIDKFACCKKCRNRRNVRKWREHYPEGYKLQRVRKMNAAEAARVNSHPKPRRKTQ
jgi:hypothetical protein